MSKITNIVNPNNIIPRTYVKINKKSVIDWVLETDKFSNYEELLKNINFNDLINELGKVQRFDDKIPLCGIFRIKTKDGTENIEKAYMKRTKRYIIKLANQRIDKLQKAYGSSENMPLKVSYRQLNKLIRLGKTKKYEISCYCMVIISVIYEAMQKSSQLKNSPYVNNLYVILEKYYKANTKNKLARFIIDYAKVLNGTSSNNTLPSVLRSKQKGGK